MGDMAIGGAQKFTSSGAAVSSKGATVTAAGSANTKGNYAQLISSTTAPGCGLIVNITAGSVTRSDNLIDIAFGAAASETVVVRNLLHSRGQDGGSTAGDSVNRYFLPIHVPAGTRISARTQCSTASGTVSLIVTVVSGAFITPSPFGTVIDLGSNTADSGGTSVDPGSSANTKGAYSELVASTSRPIYQLYVAFAIQLTAAATARHHLVDIAVGGAASEVVVVPDIQSSIDARDNLRSTVFGPIPVNIPAGSRIAARAQSTTSSAGTRLLDVIAYGVS